MDKKEKEELEKKSRDGIVIDKGAILTEQRVMENIALYTKYMEFFTVYPDLFLDLITPKESFFSLYPYQRVFLRACMRYRYHYCTAPRAFSKSFLSITAKYLRCVFLPGSKVFICAPGKEQATKIAMGNLTKIWEVWPLLQKEIISKNFSLDRVQLIFRNGSVFDIVAAQDAERGGRRNAGILDEVRDHDADMLHSVVLPLMNVSRRTSKGLINSLEPHQAQIYITSAGNKGSYAYERMVELLVNSVIDPHDYFVWGCDYRVPANAGLIDKKYVNEMRLSPTFKEDGFAREYLSIWTGGSNDSWFDYDRLQKYRCIVNAEEYPAKIPQNVGVDFKPFYIFSVDVARLRAQTVLTIIKVMMEGGRFIKKVMNIKVLPESLHFEQQACIIKEYTLRFQPREIIVDGTGLGVGLMDFMIQETTDFNTGVNYGPIGSFNDPDYLKKQPKECPRIIYVIKPTQKENGQMNSLAYSQISSGKVRFLISDMDAKTRLLGTKKGQKMKPEERIAILMPYQMTTILHQEMANLKLKAGSAVGEPILEQVNPRMGKDKWSSFEYGIWRAKEFEDDYVKKQARRNRDMKQFLFFTRR